MKTLLAIFKRCTNSAPLRCYTFRVEARSRRMFIILSRVTLPLFDAKNNWQGTHETIVSVDFALLVSVCVCFETTLRSISPLVSECRARTFYHICTSACTAPTALPPPHTHTHWMIWATLELRDPIFSHLSFTAVKEGSFCSNMRVFRHVLESLVCGSGEGWS